MIVLVVVLEVRVRVQRRDRETGNRCGTETNSGLRAAGVSAHAAESGTASAGRTMPESARKWGRRRRTRSESDSDHRTSRTQSRSLHSWVHCNWRRSPERQSAHSAADGFTSTPAARPVWPIERSCRVSSGSQQSVNRLLRRPRVVDKLPPRNGRDWVRVLTFPPHDVVV